jgi:hypothetical protein
VIGELLGIVVPVYACAALGYLWARSGRRYDTALMTDLVMMVGAPCLVFSGLTSLEIDLELLSRMALATACVLSALGLLGALVLRALGLPSTTYLSPFVFGNTGNMGLPLCLFAFGEPGLALGVGIFATVSLCHFTFGQWLWAGRASFASLLRIPLFWSATLGALVLALDVVLPLWLTRSVALLGDVAIPLMVLTLGVTLSRVRAGVLRRSLLLSVVRLGLAVACACGVAAMLDLEGVARGVLILQAAMPVAVINALMAERYGRQPDEVASLVVVSTLLSLLTTPVVLAALL